MKNLIILSNMMKLQGIYCNMDNIKSGFIATVGRPNAGKSSLINAIMKEKLTMVSKKANATRKRSFYIHMYKNNQLVFIDTPGIHEAERLLNQFMLHEALKAIGDCDVILFLAPITDRVEEYEKFLELNDKKTPHILVLTKADTITHEKILSKINQYQKYQEEFSALIPLSIKKTHGFESLYDEILKHLPIHPHLYDPQILTTQNMAQIYKEFIQESIFENMSDEIPYFSDVIIESVKDEKDITKVVASIIVESKTQKAMMIGKNGSAIKRIGINARKLIQNIANIKIFLKLNVKIVPNWSKNDKNLRKLGYFFDL